MVWVGVQHVVGWVVGWVCTLMGWVGFQKVDPCPCLSCLHAVSVCYLVQALLCLKMHHIAPKMQHTETENLKKICEGGTALSPDPSPKPHPLHPRRLRRPLDSRARLAAPPLSSFAPLYSHFWLRACYDRRRRRPPDVGRTNYRPTAPIVPTGPTYRDRPGSVICTTYKRY